MASPRRLLVPIVLAVFLAVPSAASAGTSVRGAEYLVTFRGSASIDLTQNDPGSNNQPATPSQSHVSGTLGVVDDLPADVWLPASFVAAGSGIVSGSTTQTSAVPPAPGKVAASLTATGSSTDPNGQTTSYSCTAGSIYDPGVATVQASVALGSLAIGTSWSAPGRTFTTGPLDSSPTTWTCSPSSQAGSLGLEIDPPISYSAGIPFADVGKAAFSLAATDRSTVAPCQPGPDQDDTCTGPDFHLSGTYAFAKKCDGTITYANGAQTGVCGATPGGSSTSKPVLNDMKISPSTFRAAPGGGSLARAGKTGTTISYRDSLSATTTFTVLKPVRGMRKGKRCVARGRHRGKHAKGCTRYVRKGTFTHRDKAGADRLQFTGRVHRHKLAPGSYRLRGVAKSGKVRGKALNKRFRIVR